MRALRYHDATKHQFNRFARSLGYLDWATQPDPFRRYAGARVTELPRIVLAPEVAYPALFDGSVEPAPIDDRSIGEFLRCSMGLSAWKALRGTRWALRVNPSSGNLHPTEAYLVRDAVVSHYAPREHAVEARCSLPMGAWRAFTAGEPGFLVALTSIHWREAWKYGERAFRYCQHDTGHALAALRFAAALLGWKLSLLPGWSDAHLSAVLGLDRDPDYGHAEREEAECVAVVTPAGAERWRKADPDILVQAARTAVWRGTANQLSRDHVEWPLVDEVAVATRYPGGAAHPQPSAVSRPAARGGQGAEAGDPRARTVILQRRSAVAFDGRSILPHAAFGSMLSRLGPAAPPWDAITWTSQVHLVLFIHRVEGVIPGLYAFVRDRAVVPEWRAAMRPEFLWERIDVRLPSSSGELYLLVPADVAWTANRLSCDQEIASDGFLSLAMIACVEAPLDAYGEWFYRRLFWECGLIGQVLYLEAEAAGGRGTGIGCFYDDPVHEALGLSGHAWQSLYHFSMGVPVEDTRLTTDPGYTWEPRP